MTQPQYAPQAPQQGYVQPPQQWAPPAPQGYQQPPAQPGYPHPPQQYGPPQGYAQPGFPPQGQAPQQQQPAPELAQGTLDGFFSQPSSGWGPSWSWTTPSPQPIGTTFVGLVARPITSGDVEQSVNNQGQAQTYRDGRPVLVMKVPMNVKAEPVRYTDGRAQFYVQGQARDELARAMAAVGAPEGPPEAGALIALTLSGERRNKYGTMSKQVSVQYLRPGAEADQYAQQNGIALASTDGQATPPAAPEQSAQQPQAPAQGIDVSQMSPPAAQAPVQPPAQPQPPAPSPAQMPQQQAQPPAPAPAAAPPAPGAIADLSAEQQALFARLTNAQQG